MLHYAQCDHSWYDRIKGELIIHPQSDEYGNGHAHGKTRDINEGVTFAAQQVPPGDFEVAFYHRRVSFSIN
jgi:hypothetical protein